MPNMVAIIRMKNTSAPSNKEFNFAFRDLFPNDCLLELSISSVS